MTDPLSTRAARLLEIQQLLKRIHSVHLEPHDGNWDSECSACCAQLALEGSVVGNTEWLLAELTAAEKENRIRDLATPLERWLMEQQTTDVRYQRSIRRRQNKMELIAECATAHGGDLNLAEDMIAAAADHGAHTVKFQSYSLERLNPKDAQADWLRQSWLSKAAHERLMTACQTNKVNFLSTPFDADSLQMLRDLGLTRFKIASSESMNLWWNPHNGYVEWLVSRPWGRRPAWSDSWITNLSVIPLYPTPLECVGTVPVLDGWSDHGEGLSACYRALSLGAKVLEVHVCWPGRSRVTLFDKTFEQLAELRRFMDDCQTMSTGVAQRFRERWSA